MTTQTTPPDDCIAEALRLMGYPADRNAQEVREHAHAGMQWGRNVLAHAATLEKLAAAEAERDALRLEIQALPLFSTREVIAERDAIKAKLAVAVEALKRIAAECSGADAEAYHDEDQHIARESLAQIGEAG